MLSITFSLSKTGSTDQQIGGFSYTNYFVRLPPVTWIITAQFLAWTSLAARHHRLPQNTRRCYGILLPPNVTVNGPAIASLDNMLDAAQSYFGVSVSSFPRLLRVDRLGGGCIGDRGEIRLESRCKQGWEKFGSGACAIANAFCFLSHCSSGSTTLVELR